VKKARASCQRENFLTHSLSSVVGGLVPFPSRKSSPHPSSLGLAVLVTALGLGCGGGSSSISSSDGGTTPTNPLPVVTSGYVTLYDFGSSNSNGNSPGSIVQTGDGVWYGSALSAPELSNTPPGTIFKFVVGQGVTTLHTFTAAGDAVGNFILASDGNLYGMGTVGGSGATCFLSACGSLFKVTAQGVVSDLHDFQDTDGAYPSTLVQGDDGNIYGITSGGGSHSTSLCAQTGCGTFFRMTPDGTVSVLYRFDGTHGWEPIDLVKGNDGTFYGIATFGGANNNGVFFNITPSGQFTVLHDFDSSVESPYTALVPGSDGNFYGTAVDTGESCHQGSCYCFAVCGTIFRITPQGAFSAVYNFTDYAQGSGPGTLVQGFDGNLYGTAGGGAADGVLFKVTLQGTYSIIYNFDRTKGADAPGINGLVLGTDGNLYGVSQDGGAPNAARGCPTGCGVIFGFGLK